MNVGVADAFADEFVDAALRSKSNAPAISNLQTTNTAMLSSISSLTTQTSALTSRITTLENYDLNNRATLLEGLVGGSEGNAITDLLSNSSSVSVLNNKTLRVAAVEGIRGMVNISSTLMLSNRIISSTASNTDNSIIMNMTANRIQAQSINYDDCLSINSLDSELGDREIFKINRDYLMLTIPRVANPTISKLSNNKFYLDQYTLPTIFTTLTTLGTTTSISTLSLQ